MPNSRNLNTLAALGFVVLVGMLLGFDLPQGPSRAWSQEDPSLSSWEQVERLFQGQGPRSALTPSSTALREHPESLSLLMQHMTIWVAIEGFDRARAVLDSLQSTNPSEARLQTGLLTLSIESGDDRGAMRHFEAMRTDLPSDQDGSTLDGFQLLILEAAIASRNNTEEGMARADSLLELAEMHACFHDASAFTRGILELQIQRQRAGLRLRREGLAEAIAQFEAILERALIEEYRETALRTAFALGRLHRAMGQYGTAEERLLEALPWAQQLQDRRHEALLHNHLGRCLQDQRRFAEAADHLHRASRLLEGQGDPVASAYGLLMLGWVQHVMGDPYAAQPTLQDALQLFEELQDYGGMFHSLNNLGLVSMFSERTQLAESYFERALQLADEQQLSALTPLALNNLAILYQRTGRPDRASAVYRQLLELHRASGQISDELRALNNLGLVTEQLGRTHEALVLWRQCIERGVREGNYFDHVPARINLGRMLVREGKPEEARAQLQIALEQAVESRDTLYIGDAREALAMCLEQMEAPEEALEHWTAADGDRIRMGQTFHRTPGLLHMAALEHRLGHPNLALSHVAVAESLAVLTGHPYFPSACHAERARLRLEMGEHRLARDEARLAIETLPSNRWEHTPQDQREERAIHYRAFAVLLESQLVSSMNRQSWIPDAFAQAQRLKSRSLMEYVQTGQRPILPQVPDSLAQSERELRKDADALRSAIQVAPTNTSRRDSLRGALAETITEHQLVRARILRQDPRFDQAASQTELTLEVARELLLTEETLLLDFVLPPPGAEFATHPGFVFALHARGAELFVLRDLPSLRAQLVLAVGLLATPPQAAHELAATQSVLRGLFQILLAPTAELMAQHPELIISPDGFLQRLPFAALLDSIDGTPGRYLIESHSITVTPSLASLAAVSSQGTATPPTLPWDLAIWTGRYRPVSDREDATVTGELSLSPLVHAERERRGLERGFARSTSRTLHASSKELLPGQELLGQSHVLHFIAHGYFDDLQPWRSGLYLWQDDSSTQKLEMADVYTMDFRCDLVTLSACESAREELGTGIGLEGFTQALFASGAHSVLSTLWAIDDASAPEFMESFYEGLSLGESKAQALRQTQMEFLGDEKLRHPFYWAPYLLQGDGRGVIQLTRRGALSFGWPPRFGWAPLLLIAGILGLLVAWRLARREPVSSH